MGGIIEPDHPRLMTHDLAILDRLHNGFMGSHPIFRMDTAIETFISPIKTPRNQAK